MDLRAIGPFPGVIQIAASIEEHELLTDPAKLPAGAAGALTYHGGRVIDQGKGRVINIYLGNTSVNIADFDAFTKAICENGYYLSPDGKDSTPAIFGGSQLVPWPFRSMTVDDSEIQSWLNASFQPDPYLNFALIFPAGSTVTMQGSATCTAFCGYHTRTSRGIYYQVIGDPSCSGCHGNFTPAQARMMVQAHEIAEWRSDPDGTGWYNDQTGMENADECAWNLVPWGPPEKGWAVQPMAVNGVGCYTGTYVPPTPPPPPPPPPPGQAYLVWLRGELILSDGAVWPIEAKFTPPPGLAGSQ